MTAYFVVFMLAVLVGCLVAVQHYWNARRWKSVEPLPDELCQATLFVSEKEYRIRRPIALVGRVDQVYRIGRRLFVTDTKRRDKARAYEGDRVQLSLYRLLIERALNPWWRRWIYPYTIDQRAWLRCVTPKGVTYVEVATRPESELVALYKRYRTVQRHEQLPRPSTSPVLCVSCNYRTDCVHIDNVDR